MTATRIAIFALASFALAGCPPKSDGPAPTVEITFPEEGSIQRNDRIRFQGTAEGATQVEIDGQVAEVVGGEWEVLVPVSQGEVTVTATADAASDDVTFTVDSVPPQLEVTSPERAMYQLTSDGETVRVTGTVADEGTGLELIKVGEQIIQPATSGAWQWDLTLQPGLNEITVTARDIAGNEVEDIRGVMYGDFIAPQETISPAFDIWLDQQAVPDIEAVVEGFLTPQNLTVMASAFESENVKVSSIEIEEPDLTVTLRRGAVDMYLVARNVVVNGTFTLSGTEYPIVVRASRIGVSMTVTPVADENGLLDVEFSEPVLELTSEELSYDIADLSDEDNQFLEDLVIQMAQSGFGYVMSLGLFQALYDPDILKRKVSFLGREIAFDVRFRDIDIFPDGGLFRTSVTMPADRWADVRDDSPGALNRTPGPGTGSEPFADIGFSATQNALDRIFHGIWYSGLFHHTLAGNDFSGIELPVELNAGSLGTLIDSQIANIETPTTPAGIRVRPMFQPVAEFDTENSRLLIRMGEFMADLLLLPAGQEPVVIASVTTFLDLSVNVGITEGVVVQLDFETELRADVADEPVVDLDDDKVEQLLEDIVALIPTLVAQSLDLRGEADITWVTLGNPRIEVHGVEEDHATINLDIEPNPQTLEAPDPDDGM